MSSRIARLFDAMADSYDDLEPWYEHLYAVLHGILRAELAPPGDGRPRRALDAGCGTGFQTVLLQELGYATHGLDIAPALLAVARRRLPTAALALGSLEALPYGDGRFDVVTCCGSTLSLVAAPARALGEIGRVLRPGGRLLIECEHKWSLDLAWALVSSLTSDSLDYGVSPADAWRQVARPLGEGLVLEYPFRAADGAIARMPLRLFTVSELRAMLEAAGLTPQRRWGIHAITNVIPSTVLHRERLPRPLAAIFGPLCAIDRRLGRFPPARLLANSLVILARRAARERAEVIEPATPGTQGEGGGGRCHGASLTGRISAPGSRRVCRCGWTLMSAAPPSRAVVCYVGAVSIRRTPQISNG
jgi:SAM-dependent methyltransferase